MNRVQPGYVCRSEDFRFLPQVLRCYSHLLSVVEDSISIEFNIYLYSCYITFPRETHYSKGSNIFFGRFGTFRRSLRSILRSPFLSSDFVTFKIF